MQLSCCLNVFDCVAVPKAVEAELNDLVLPEYISRKPVSELGCHYVKGAMGSLHAGELETMVLAQETRAELS